MKGVCLNKVPVLSPVFVSKLFCQIICFVFFSMFRFQSPPGLIINISLAANKGKRRFSTERYRLYSKSNTVVTGEQCMREFVTKWNNFFPLRNSRKFTPKFSDFFSKWKATTMADFVERAIQPFPKVLKMFLEADSNLLGI